MAKINDKSEWAVKKHAAALGKSFARCAGCHGTSGKVEDGRMKCARVGSNGAWVSAAQSQRCDGIRPVVVEDDVWPPKTATRTIGRLSAA